MNIPRVDCLVPVYNGGVFLKGSLQSLLRQDYPALRIIVVNDGSTDQSSSLLRTLAAEDPRILLIEKANGGIVEALNTGLQHVDAEFVARHDADDLADPHRIGVQARFLAGRPDVSAVGGSARHIDERGSDLGTIARFDPPEFASADNAPAREPYLLHPFLMVRTDALRSAGGYRHVLHAEDSDLYWRLQERGRLVSHPALLGSYRMHPESISSSSIRSGRAMSLSSQLAALSARRRRSGRLDLTFSSADAKALRMKIHLAEMLAVYQDQLDADERSWLSLAAALKLMELADYRPYELETEDCAFLHQAWNARADALQASNRSLANKAVLGTAARLLALGRVAQARALPQVPFGPGFVAKVAVRRLVPDALYRRVRMALGRRRRMPPAATI